MVNQCYNCEFSGGEKRKTNGSIDDCKSQCLADPSCVGIDAGNSNNACYFVDSTNVETSATSNYQAWKKSTNCGNDFFSNCLKFNSVLINFST